MDDPKLAFAQKDKNLEIKAKPPPPPNLPPLSMKRQPVASEMKCVMETNVLFMVSNLIIVSPGFSCEFKKY